MIEDAHAVEYDYSANGREEFEPAGGDETWWEGRVVPDDDDPDPEAVRDDDVPRALPVRGFAIVTAEAFAEVDEPGQAAIVGDGEEAVLPENGDVMMYGDGGVGKTTLAIDLACHLAAGDPWLGIAVSRPVQVLIVENEGPRALFRKKLRAKLEAWEGSAVENRLLLLEEPWAEFSFADKKHREALGQAIVEHGIDVVIVGPVTASGMLEAGTIQEVRAFVANLKRVRAQCGRNITFFLVHHENKGGAVSGAWEGVGDTLLHVQGEGNGRTRLYVQKARWASSRHATTLRLAWTEGEGFAVDDDDAREAQKQADIAAALDWIVAYVTEQPGQARGKVEDAYASATGTKGARARAREAIEKQLETLGDWQNGTARPPALATTSGGTSHGTYLIPFTDAVSPLAEPLFGETGEKNPDPEPGGVLAVSPPTLRGGETNGESTDGVESQPSAAPSDPGTANTMRAPESSP